MSKHTFVAHDHLGIVGESLLSALLQKTKRERKANFNDLTRIAKIAGILDKNSKPTFIGQAVDATGALGILFIEDSSSNIGAFTNG